MRKEYTFHSKEEKLEIVKRYLSGESSKALGKELGISQDIEEKIPSIAKAWQQRPLEAIYLFRHHVVAEDGVVSSARYMTRVTGRLGMGRMGFAQ